MITFDPDQFRSMLDHAHKRSIFSATHPQARSLFKEYLQATAPTLPHFPTDGITALQFTLFDNVADPQSSARYVPTMKSRFATTVKAWDRLNIDWRKPHHVAWEATACLRRIDDTMEVAERLAERSLLSPDVPDTLRELQDLTDGVGLFGICHQRKPGMGSRWTDVLAHVRWSGLGPPEAAFLVRPDFTGFETHAFQQQTATGSPLGGFAVAQARVAYYERLAGWATELSRYD